MAVRISEDDGETWSGPRILHAGRAAYSSLAVLGEGSIGCLYERGDHRQYERITLARFSFDWLRSD